ncbi:MAG: DUF58 domain-containing protein [Planctomycetota bacterium JB042]
MAASSNEPSVAEIVQKVRRIQIVASRAVDDLFAGEYHSVFRGRGMEFDEVREYQPGDEVRTIDWNVTARNGAPFVKRYREERELTVQFVVDVSASGVFGSTDRSKLELAVEVAALLMFSALKNNDKVGLIQFAGDVRRYLPPRKGKASVLRLLRELVAARPVAGETRLDRALEFLTRVQRRKAVVFLVSDFLGDGWERPLRIARARHDVVAITVDDPRERALPDAGFVTLEDAETGERVEVDLSHRGLRSAFERRAREREARLEEALRRTGVDRLPVRTDEPYLKSLHRFFRMRERRMR